MSDADNRVCEKCDAQSQYEKTVCRIAGTMRMVLFSPLPLEKGTGQSEEFEFRADFFKSSLTFPFPLRKEEATKKKSTCEQFLKIEL